MAMNKMIFEMCSRHMLFYIDMFYNFLNEFGNRNLSLFPSFNNRTKTWDIHPNRTGMGIMARHLIYLTHSRYFNPLGYQIINILNTKVFYIAIIFTWQLTTRYWFLSDKIGVSAQEHRVCVGLFNCLVCKCSSGLSRHSVFLNHKIASQSNCNISIQKGWLWFGVKWGAPPGPG